MSKFVKSCLFVCLFCVLLCGSSLAETDILFLIDTTDSMSGEISDFKNALSQILEAVDANSPCSDSIMYSVADYKKYSYAIDGINLDLPFTDNTESVLDAIDDLEAEGNSGALLLALGGLSNNWTSTSGELSFCGRAEARKILVLAGDFPGNDESDDSFHPTLEETIKALQAENITVFALNPLDYFHGLNMLHNGHRQAREITDATGGALFCNALSNLSFIKESITNAVVCVSLSKDDDLDDSNALDCRSYQDSLTYSIYWENTGDGTLEDAYVVDFLPTEITYLEGFTQFDPNTSSVIAADSNYNESDHTYTWQLGDVAQGTSGYLELEVEVNGNAIPGMYIQNKAELWGMVYDVNDQNPVSRCVGTAYKDTLVCCWCDTSVIYVDMNASGYDTGMSWENAYSGRDGLVKAFERATQSQCGLSTTIYIAEGTYVPQTSGFVLEDGMAIYGGFPPGGCDFRERNPKRFKTILTGLIDD